MAVLSDAVRLQIWRGLMRYWSHLREPLGLTKADIRAAVNAADSWADANAAAYNSALPQPFRGAASAGQKAILLAIVTLARYSGEDIKKLLGEVD